MYIYIYICMFLHDKASSGTKDVCAHNFEKDGSCTYMSIITAAMTPSSARKHTLTMTAMAMRARDCTFSAGS